MQWCTVCRLHVHLLATSCKKLPGGFQPNFYEIVAFLAHQARFLETKLKLKLSFELKFQISIQPYICYKSIT